MFKAWLVIQSRDLMLSEISEALDCEPDGGYDKGSYSRIRRGPREWTSWELELVWPPGQHGGTAGLTNAIESLGQPLAERAARLAALGAKVHVDVLQELDESSATHGVYLAAGALQWMSSASATFGVDQYVECGDSPCEGAEH